MKLIYEGRHRTQIMSDEELIADILTTEDNFLKNMYQCMLNSKQEIYDFENGYGASVVRGVGTYGFAEGKWEIVLIEFKGKETFHFELVNEPFSIHRDNLNDVLLELKDKSEQLRR